MMLRSLVNGIPKAVFVFDVLLLCCIFKPCGACLTCFRFVILFVESAVSLARLLVKFHHKVLGVVADCGVPRCGSPLPRNVP